MHPALTSLSARMVARPAEIATLKAGGKRVVGFFPGDFVPEELIRAAGAVPLCLIHGGDPNVVDASASVTTRFLCPFARAQMGEVVLKEQPFYGLVDLLVTPISCQHLRRAGDIWEYFGGVPVFRLGIPYKDDTDRGLDYYVMMLGLLKKRLEDLTGQRIQNDALQEAISVYNRLRSLLKSAGDLRGGPGAVLTTLDFVKLNHASSYLDPMEMIRILDDIVRDEGHVTTGPKRAGHRLLLTGPNVAYGDYKMLELVEACGGDIVVEEVLEGVRSYRTNVSPEGDMLRALAFKYLRDRVPAAFMRLSAKRRFDFILDLARQKRVRGIVWYQLLYCDTYEIESHYFRARLSEAGLPMLKLESDYGVQDTGPLKTRIEAFLETIGEAR